jgi:predicted Zn-dependent protease
MVINSSTPNAWALPGGKIAINRGLLVELKNEAELAAVLGHEIVHSAARHQAKQMERGMLLQGAVLAAGIAARNSDYRNLAVGGAALGANLIHQGYSREAEREADLYGMKYMARAGYDPSAAVGLQKTFVRLSKKHSPSWLAGLFASHPPSQQRVELNRQTAAKMAVKGGELGEKRYRNAIARLQKTRPAYKALDEGRVALSKGQTRKAESLASKAIRIESREAAFYGLRGEARARAGNHRSALADYNKALRLDDRFFYHYLKRGETRLALNDRRGARSDLQKSVELLPTANGYYALGQLEQRNGNYRQAKAYYAKAAGSRSKSGVAASKALVRMDLSNNPGRYLKTRLEVDRQGRVYALISNTTALPVRNVTFTVGKKDPFGRVSRGSTHRVRKLIYPGKAVRVATGISGVTQSKQLRQLGLRFERAEVAER